MSYQHFTSLPPEQEQAFVVYESRTVETSKKALMAGLIAAGAFFVLMVIIVFSFDAPENKMAGDDMGMLEGTTGD